MEPIIYSFLNAVFLFFMYDTEAFVEYVKLFRLNKLFKIKEYEEYVDTYSSGSYWEYLAYEKRTFLRKLLSCPFCLRFWMNMLGLFFYRDSVIFIINLWLTLFLYLILKTLLKRSEE